MRKEKIHSGRIAIVAGGMGYVGSAIARQLAVDDMQVAVLYHRSTEKEASKFLATLPGKGHKAYRCDLQNPEEVSQVIATVEKETGPIYACIHAAGSLPYRKQIHQSSIQELREQFDAGVFSTFNFLSVCARTLKERKQGVIIGITTAAVISTTNTKARGVYSPVKFAVQGMLAALKEELSPHGERVYSVAPGVMPGGLNKDTPQAFLDMVRQTSPTKMLAEATDVANAVSFLCSDAARNVSNLTLLIAPESGSL